MESAFQYQLGALTAQLGEICAMAAEAMNDATYALLEANRGIADAVISGHDEIAAMSSSAQETTYLLLSMRAPVAADLSAVIDAVQIAQDTERMGELATEVAKTACRRHPDHAVPVEANRPIADMSAFAVALARDAHDMLLSGDCHTAAQISHDSEAMERLHRELLTALIGERWKNGVAVAVDVTLLGGCYHRFSDHAMRIARRVASRTAGRHERRHPRHQTGHVSAVSSESA